MHPFAKAVEERVKHDTGLSKFPQLNGLANLIVGLTPERGRPRPLAVRLRDANNGR
jgi:hypothetical protein